MKSKYILTIGIVGAVALAAIVSMVVVLPQRGQISLPKSLVTNSSSSVADASTDTAIHEPAVESEICTICHVDNLKTQHVDNIGLTCDTCHGSSARTEVKAALTSFKGNGTKATCGSCHTFHQDLTQLHTSSQMIDACYACHEREIRELHLQYQKDNVSKYPYVCDVCHNNPDYVPSNLATGNSGNRKSSNCFTCHGSDGSAKAFAANHPYIAPDKHTATNSDCLGSGCHSSDLRDTHASDRNNDNISGCSDCHRADFSLVDKSGGDCLSCHLGQSPDHAYVGNADKHNSASDISSCIQSSCHISNNLKEEHFGRSPSGSGAFQCSTCHSSSRAEVQSAIQDGNSSCSACHASADFHISEHEPTQVDASCGSCHANSSNLAREHLDRGLDCATCHSGTARIEAKNAVAAFAADGTRATCSLCHVETGTHTSVHQPAVDDSSCASCHADNLEVEHVEKRALSCDTCHASTARQEAKDSFASFKATGNKATCSACHPDAGSHIAIHQPAVDSRDCTICHADNLKTQHVDNKGLSCDTCHGSTARQEAKNAIAAFAANQTKATCSTCHPGTNSHTDAHQPALDYGSCAACHADNLKVQHVDNLGLSCGTCHSSGARQEAKDAFSRYKATGVKATCSTCHANAGRHLTVACATCHGPTGPRPIASIGKHNLHFSIDLASAAYGDTTNRSNAGGYAFGCGTCHALDSSLHSNGTVNVELSSGAAPNGTLKAFNTAAGANYSAANCVNTYCHSNGQTGGNLVSATINWFTGSAGCVSCHGYPPSTGRHTKHVIEEQFPCYACHSATVNSSSAIIDKSKHVNGAKDVVFDYGFVGDPSFKVTYSQGIPTCTGRCHGQTHNFGWNGSGGVTLPTSTPTPNLNRTPTPTSTPRPSTTPRPSPTRDAPSLVAMPRPDD